MPKIKTITITVTSQRTQWYQRAEATTSIMFELDEDEQAKAVDIRAKVRSMLNKENNAGVQLQMDDLIARIPEEQLKQLQQQNDTKALPAPSMSNGIPANAKKQSCRKCADAGVLSTVFFVMVPKKDGSGKLVPEQWNEDGSLHYKTCAGR